VHKIGAYDTQPLDPANPDQTAKAHHDDEEGSVFYGLARALAVEVDRHVLRQVELMWAGQGSLYGDAGELDKSGERVAVGNDQRAGFGSERDPELGQRREGDACQRMACPGTPVCSGHGRCMSMKQMATEANAAPFAGERGWVALLGGFLSGLQLTFVS